MRRVASAQRKHPHIAQAALTERTVNCLARVGLATQQVGMGLAKAGRNLEIAGCLVITADIQ